MIWTLFLSYQLLQHGERDHAQTTLPIIELFAFNTLLSTDRDHEDFLGTGRRFPL